MYSEFPNSDQKMKVEKDQKANPNQNIVMWKNVPNYPLVKDLPKAVKVEKIVKPQNH